MSKSSILTQLRKLESKLARLHDDLNDKYGAAHNLTQQSMWSYALVFSILSDVEALFDEQSLLEDDE